MDMRTTQVCFATPAAILTDAASAPVVPRKYGLVHNVEPAYVEAKRPGMQAAALKVFRQMALGSTASLPLADRALDNGAVFSPTQAMIDLEVNQALYKFYQGMEVNEETMCVDLIEEMRVLRQPNVSGNRTHGPALPPGRLATAAFDRAYCDHELPSRRRATRSCWTGPIGPGATWWPPGANRARCRPSLASGPHRCRRPQRIACVGQLTKPDMASFTKEHQVSNRKVNIGVIGAAESPRAARFQEC